LRTCSAEDLIVLKLFAFRPRDVLDAETIVIRQRAALDWQYIATNLQPLAEVKGQPEIMATFEKLRRAW
jgi:acyl dehydratase